MGQICGTWVETRPNRCTQPGTPQSSWSGAAHHRPGLTSCSSYCVVDLLLQGLIFSTDLWNSSLRTSASHEVQVLSRLLARDRQSVTGNNLLLVQELSGMNPWTATPGRLKAALQAEETVDVPVPDRWRLGYLSSLLRQRGEAHHLALEEDEDQLTDLINSMVIN